MNKFVTENLILLEFLVDNIYFTESVKCKLKCMEGETNVMFQFLDNKPVVISGEELAQSSGACPGVRCGKSCLFSMSTEQGIEALGNFLIHLKVYQKFPRGVLPNTIDVACGEICVSELFQDLMESAMSGADKAWVKCQKETVKLYQCGECAGSVSCYVRMSCYGKYIVTQCKMNIGDFRTGQQQHACDDAQPKQTKCLPVPGEIVPPEANVAALAKPAKILNNDPCNQIDRVVQPYLTNAAQGDYVQGGQGAKEMAYQMVGAMPMGQAQYPCPPPARTCPPPSCPPPRPPCPPAPQPCAPCPRCITPCAPCPACAPVSKFPKEMEPRPPPLPKKHKPIKKPSKDKLILRLAMPNTEPCNCPYEFEFVTPAAWPRESLGRQCRDAQCDCRDFPENYLIEYYGKLALAQLISKNVAEEMRREQIYGICPVGEFANKPRGKGGIGALLFECLGVTQLMSDFAKGLLDGDGHGGRGGLGDDDDDDKKRKKKKINQFGGVNVPDKKPKLCICYPCIPCNPCGPCYPCGPCGPCEPPVCRPCSPCRPYSPPICRPPINPPCRPSVGSRSPCVSICPPCGTSICSSPTGTTYSRCSPY